MHPAHIAMFSIAAHGHVNPSLEIVRELVARGHRVTYAVPESFAGKVAVTGAEPRIYRSTLPTEDEPEAWGTEVIDNVEPFLADAVQALPQQLAAYEGDEPDLVLADITAYPARVLAHRWGVPFVQLSPNLVAWEGYEEEVAAPMVAEIMSTERGRAYYARFRAWLDENGLSHLSPDEFAGRPPRSLVVMPKALQPQADRVDESVYTFVGACQGDRAEQGDWQRPADAEKVLLVSLGSAFTKEPEFYRECLRAFGDLPGWHVVLQIGKFVDPAELGPVPDNVEVHDWVPQLAVLRQADAFITHAGAGGSQEGLATATPMVAVPQAVDQFGNAAVLESLGVARHVPKEQATAQALREAVLAVADDPEVAARLAAVGREMAAEGGTKRAADLIEAELPAR
ncbi:macrolide-inactivating glycosyltransferase [Streptomyces sp. GC420]|uniref:macrolide-inactivating glycosyltransferase n=1 Tax=Streptomyces sp. GC420 TaxID=2697568 RepID=UPI001414ECA2|nr:macrolide-inactivating glycosyltransferase [Streptomyces sp. GC420]NBM18074.1 macrolide-inactivating glycosyltransferase [Streptomyces sp. GC420]